MDVEIQNMIAGSYEEQNEKAIKILSFVDKIEKSDGNRNRKLTFANKQLATLVIANKALMKVVENAIKRKSWEFEE